MDLTKFREKYGPGLLRAQRIDAYNRRRPAETDTPIAESVLRDFAYGNPPFEHVNDYARNS
jgi:hypothetical protein